MSIDVASLPLDEIQARILAGETLSKEEYQAVIARFRGERKAAAATSAKGRGKQLPADFDLNKDLDDLFAGMTKKEG